jgi:hypothetical protein
MLAVGNLAPDQVNRLTRGKLFTCVAGSEEEHQQLHKFCSELTAWLDEVGLELDALSPEEVTQFVVSTFPDGVCE